MTPLTVACLTSSFGVVLFFPLALVEVRNFAFEAISFLSWLPLVYYGLGTVGAYILWYQGVSKVPASTAGVFSGILPVSAVILSGIFLKEPIFWFYWAGIICVLVAIVFMVREPLRQIKG